MRELSEGWYGCGRRDVVVDRDVLEDARARVLRDPLAQEEDGDEGEDDERCDDLARDDVG